MATIIDSLLVTLGLDGSKFEAGRKKVDKGLDETGDKADKAGKKTKKAGDDGAKGMEGLAKKAAGFLAIIGGTMAIKRFVEDTIASSAAIDRLSKNLGTTAEVVSSWSNAAELAGGSAQGLQGSMDMLSRAQTEMQLTGQSGLIPYLSALGVAMADASGKARPVEDILLDLSGAFEKLPRTTANNLGRMMGIDEGTMNLLLKGRQEVELMVKRQKEFGAVSKEQAAQASKLQESLRRGKQTFEAWGRAILVEAAPAIEKLLSMLDAFGTWVMDNKEAVQNFLLIMAVGLAAVAAAATPINLVVVAVTALAAALALLYQDYQTWKRGGDSLIDWGKWEPGIKAAINGLTWIRNLLADVMYRGIAMGDAIVHGFAAALDSIKLVKAMLSDLAYRAAATADILGAVFHRDWARARAAYAELKQGNGAPQQALVELNQDAAREAFALGEVVNGNGKPYAPEYRDDLGNARKTAETPTLEGGKKQAVDYFVAQGWSKEQAAGIAANLQRESMFAPGAVGDKGAAYGIAQWHPDRQAEFARVFGKPIQGSSLQDQLAFVQYELTKGQEQGAGAKLKTATSAAQAAGIISKNYERPADTEGEAVRRGKLADMLMQGSPGASQYAQAAGAPAIAATQAPRTAAQPASTNNETHIGEIKVYTAATDADGIAKDMGRSMNYLFASQANYGLS